MSLLLFPDFWVDTAPNALQLPVIEISNKQLVGVTLSTENGVFNCCKDFLKCLLLFLLPNPWLVFLGQVCERFYCGCLIGNTVFHEVACSNKSAVLVDVLGGVGHSIASTIFREGS